MTPDPTLIEQVPLAAHWEKECNRYINGECHSRRCLVRGGWSAGPVDYSIATCEEHETAVALRTLQGSAALPSEAMIERGREAVQAMIDMPVGTRSPMFLINRKEALTLLESYRRDVNALAMRATTPTAPDQP